MKNSSLRGERRKKIATVCGDFEAHSSRMKYHDYLAVELVDYRHTLPYDVTGKIGKTWGDIKNLEDVWQDEGDDDDIT